MLELGQPVSKQRGARHLVRRCDLDLEVESTLADRGRIELFQIVRRADDDDPRVAGGYQFREQRVGRFGCLVAGTHRHVPILEETVHLIEEQHTRGLSTRRTEHRNHLLGCLVDPTGCNVAKGCRDDRKPECASERVGKSGLAITGQSEQQDAIA